MECRRGADKGDAVVRPGCESALKQSPGGQPSGQGAVSARAMPCVISRGICENNSQQVSLAREAEDPA